MVLYYNGYVQLETKVEHCNRAKRYTVEATEISKNIIILMYQWQQHNSSMPTCITALKRVQFCVHVFFNTWAQHMFISDWAQSKQ